ncbi:MAG: fumarate hydratase C-terminal domain-containing protein [Phycisphaerae bacterium]|nr:fumarate hydratase C-terminal domain-containing protein [Phycisphaerae bacterium]
MSDPVRIDLPLNRATARSLRAGQVVELFGEMYTARDAAHRRLIELIDSGGELPVDLTDITIYYVGPSPAPRGAPIGSAGPTSSYRMDPYSPLLIARGQTGMIGKGPRGEGVLAAMREYGAVYFAAVGGAAALIARTIKSYEVVAYDDLGAEALARITVEGFPCVVAQDSVGGDLYKRPK